MALADCIEKALRAKQITDKQAEKIRKFAAAREEMSEQDIVERFIREAVERRRQTQLGIIAAKHNLADIKSHPKGIGRGVDAKIAHDASGQAHYSNVDYRQKIVRATFHQRLAGFMDRYRTKNLGFTQDRAGLDRVMDELHGTSTGDPDAKVFAGVLADTAEYGRLRLNVAGGNVPARRDWGWVHSHNAREIAKVPFEEWRDFIAETLDPSKIFDTNGKPMTAERLDRLLSDLYQGFVDQSKVTSRDAPRSVPHRPDHRLLAFKDGPAWRQYNARFGDPDIYHAITSHFDHLAGDIGLMEILGPNPDAAFHGFMKMSQDSGYPYLTKDFLHGTKITRDTYAVVTGRTNQVVSEGLANFETASRNYLSAVQLPSAFLTSFNDLVTVRMTRAFNGMPSTKMLNGLLKEMGTPGGAEARLFGVKAGLGADQWIRYALGAQRFQEISGSGLTARLSDLTFRATLLSPWTDGNQKLFGKEFIAFVGDQVGRNFNEVNPLLRAQFERYGITERHWEVIRRTPLTDFEGVKYLNPTDVVELSRKEIKDLAHIFRGAAEDIQAELGLRGKRDAALGRRLDSAEKTTQPIGGRISLIIDAANRFHEMVLTEIDYAVVVPDARIRGIATQGQMRGSLYGEIARDVAMYKQFAVSLMARHLTRGAVAIDGLSRVKYLANLAVGMTVMGAVVLQSKALRDGKDPYDMTSVKFWQRAFIQGGAGSIYADFIVDNVSRYGKGPVVSFIGPKAAVIDDLYLLTRGNLDKYLEGREINFKAQMIKATKDYTPLVRAWYARIAFDRLVFDELQKAGDPKAHQSFRRIMQRTRKNYGQEFWWKPGRPTPRRLPDVGKAVGK